MSLSISGRRPPAWRARLSRARTTTGTPPHADAPGRRRTCPPPGWPPGRTGDISALPTFTTIRSTSEPPSSTPTASPHLRRRLSAWPPHRRQNPASESPPGSPGGVRCVPTQIRQVRVGGRVTGRPTLVPRVRRLVSLAEPAPSGSTGASRRGQGCSHPPERLPGRAALSFPRRLRPAT